MRAKREREPEKAEKGDEFIFRADRQLLAESGPLLAALTRQKDRQEKCLLAASYQLPYGMPYLSM